jgi:DNA-binding response OmpR family regulator
MADKPIFLLLEDSENDVILVQRAFQKGNILNPLITLRNAEEGMAYLLGSGAYNDREHFPVPGLILLDLKLPGIDGFDFLRWLRQQPCLEKLRVVVLSSSGEVRDIDLAYKLGANSYLIKPLDFERFVEISLALNGYWLWLDKRPEELAAGLTSGEPKLKPLSAPNRNRE